MQQVIPPSSQTNINTVQIPLDMAYRASDYATLAELVAALTPGDPGRMVVIDVTRDVAEDITFDNLTSVVFMPGAFLHVLAFRTLTLTKQPIVVNPLQQVFTFESDLSPDVVAGGWYECRPEWFSNVLDADQFARAAGTANSFAQPIRLLLSRETRLQAAVALLEHVTIVQEDAEHGRITGDGSLQLNNNLITTPTNVQPWFLFAVTGGVTGFLNTTVVYPEWFATGFNDNALNLAIDMATAITEFHMNRRVTVDLTYAFGTYMITTSAVIPERVTLRSRGAVVTGNGTTLDIQGLLDIGTTQVFEGNPGSLTVIGKVQDGGVYPEWFGAAADGVRYCRDAFRAALQFARSSGSELRLSQGTYFIDGPDTLDVETDSNFRGIVGAGYGCVLTGAPGPGYSLLTIQRGSGGGAPYGACKLENFRITLQSASHDSACALAIEGEVSDVVLERVWMQGPTGCRMRGVDRAQAIKPGCTFRQCTFSGNHHKLWTPLISASSTFAITRIGSSDTAWGKVVFDQCVFNGCLPECRGDEVTFLNSRFEAQRVWPVFYTHEQIEFLHGSLVIDGCVFADGDTAVRASAELPNDTISQVTVRNSRVLGGIRAGGAPSAPVVRWAGAPDKLKSVTVANCEFPVLTNASGHPIWNLGGAVVSVTGCTSQQVGLTSLMLSNVSNFTTRNVVRRTLGPFGEGGLSFTRKCSAVVTSSPNTFTFRVVEGELLYAVYVSDPCWLRSIMLRLNRHTTGEWGLQITKNDVATVYIPVLSSSPILGINGNMVCFFDAAAVPPLERGDYLTMRIATQAGVTPDPAGTNWNVLAELQFMS
jgi:hypothetical protein